MFRDKCLVRPSRWDGTTLPYRPEVPVVLGFRCATDPARLRVHVPDAEGNYRGLVPGREYVERQINAVPLHDGTPLPAMKRDAATQVEWGDLPDVDAPADVERYRVDAAAVRIWRTVLRRSAARPGTKRSRPAPDEV